MAVNGIERAPTNEERADFRDLDELTGMRVFLGKIGDIEMKFVKQYLPFDAQNAKLDFRDKIENAEKESERRWGYVKASDIENIDFGDLEKYGKSDRFELIDVDEEVEIVVVNGQRSSVKIGYTVKYKTKNRGFGVSVFMPTDVYEKRFNKGKPKE